MKIPVRIGLVWAIAVGTWLLAACGGSTPSSASGLAGPAEVGSTAAPPHGTPTPILTASSIPSTTLLPVPTRTPRPTPTVLPTFPPDTEVAGINLGGLTMAEARDLVYPRIARPLECSVGATTFVIEPDDLDLEVALDTLLTEVSHPANREGDTHTEAEKTWIPHPVPFRFDETALRQKLAASVPQVVISPTLDVRIDATDPISRSFVFFPQRVVDIDRAVRQVEDRLRWPRLSRHIRLALRYDHPDHGNPVNNNGAPPGAMKPPPRASFEQVRQQVDAMAEQWDGIVGFYLYDLASGATVTRHENTVFSGASVMKAAILLHAYATLPEFTEEEHQWIAEMIVESDNLAANHVLAASASGTGTEDALVGATMMNEMLKSHLGLQHTYQYMPYEAADYLIEVRGMTIQRGPEHEGPPPYTEADPMLRTTPAEMSRIFLEIDRCSQGKGPLLRTFTETLTIDRCQEMLDWFAQNADDTRIRAGLPATVRVEHKSGWIEDMQCDVGIIRSPGGDFVLAIYLYRETDQLYDAVAAPVIAAFARMVYTAYNPLVASD
ncbi:MAG: serine hydrolase [Chloroflexaceae bacterium]|nr:serine hydrolase [Chloroflexaceae bacterium]